MSAERSPRLRSDRPFKIRHRPWFGRTPLNGMVWEFQLRLPESPTGFVCIQVRDGGPFNDYRSFSEALAEAREHRAKLRTGELDTED